MSCDDNSATQRAQAMATSRRRSGNGSTIMFDLALDRVFSATSPAGSIFDEFVLTGQDFEALGPGIADIVIHAEGDNFTANFSYQVGLQYRYRNGPWATAAVLPNQTSGAYVISSPFNDRSKLGMRIRLVLQTQITGVVVVPQHGNLNLCAAVRIFQG